MYTTANTTEGLRNSSASESKPLEGEACTVDYLMALVAGHAVGAILPDESLQQFVLRKTLADSFTVTQPPSVSSGIPQNLSG